MRGASRGRFEAEQDAAPARVFRKHTLGRRDNAGVRKRVCGVTVRANYVALPFAAGRGQDEGGETPPDKDAPRPSCPGSTVLSPKIAAVERREAMRFRTTPCRKRCRERNKTTCASRRSMPLIL